MFCVVVVGLCWWCWWDRRAVRGWLVLYGVGGPACLACGMSVSAVRVLACVGALTCVVCVVRVCFVWFGVARRGMVWSGVARCVLVWLNVTWCGVFGVARCGSVWFCAGGLVWRGVACGAVW